MHAIFECMSLQVIEKRKHPDAKLMLPGYVSRAEAMKFMEKSQASLERYAAQGKLKPKMQQVAGKRPEPVYLYSELQELKEAEEKRKAARFPSQLAPKAPPASQQIANVALEKIGASGIALTSAIEHFLNKPRAVLISEKLWLSIDEAELYSGLARADLLRLAKSGDIVARKSSGWKLQRRSLEEFNG